LLCALSVSRSVVLATVPLAAVLGGLRFEWLCVVAFLLSCHAVFVDLAFQATVPQFVDHDRLVQANARLGTTESAAGIVGPGLGGLLVQGLGAPLAIVADALALLGAGLLLSRLRVDEPPCAPRAADASLASEIRHGLVVLWQHAALRWTALLLGLWRFLKHAFAALFVLFAVRELGLSAEHVGLVSSAIGAGFLCSSLALPRITRRIGLGPTMLGGLALTALCWSLVAAVRGGGIASLAALALAMGGEGFGAGLFFLGFVALRQAAAPAHCRARVFASMRFVSIATAPLGALAGGWLGEHVGMRATLWMSAAAGVALVAGAALASPIARMRELPPASE
jgi:Na+/melibiose symporter-like transporter